MGRRSVVVSVVAAVLASYLCRAEATPGLRRLRRRVVAAVDDERANEYPMERTLLDDMDLLDVQSLLGESDLSLSLSYSVSSPQGRAKSEKKKGTKKGTRNSASSKKKKGSSKSSSGSKKKGSSKSKKQMGRKQSGSHKSASSSSSSSSNSRKSSASRHRSAPSSENIDSSDPYVVDSSDPSEDPSEVDRGAAIEEQCGTSQDERSDAILTVLQQVSEEADLTDSSTPQFVARHWIDALDGAIVCGDDVDRLIQRYRLAVIYYGMNGDEWLNCRADLPDSPSNLGPCVTNDVENPNVPVARFLDAAHECTWFGVRCDTTQVTVLDLHENNLQGSLPLELFGFTALKQLSMDTNAITGNILEDISELTSLETIDLDTNQLTGTLPESLFSMTQLLAIDLNTNLLTGTLPDSIGNLVNLNLLQLEENRLRGPIPSDALLNLEQLVLLTVQDNDMTGSVENICDVIPDRREDGFDIYLRFFNVDCAGPSPEIECSCCTCF